MRRRTGYAGMRAYFEGFSPLVERGSSRSDKRRFCLDPELAQKHDLFMTSALFSSRTQWNLSANALSRKTSDLRQGGANILDLTESNPTRCHFDYPRDAILKAIAQPESLFYEPSARGLRPARESICRYYRTRVERPLDPEHIFLTASTSEAYSFVFRLLANPGDEILVPQPSYPLFDFLAQLNDVVLRPYALEYDRAWQIDLGSLEQRLSSRTRALILVNPNNPTGSGVSAAEREPLVEFCRRRGLALVSDEVFNDFSFADSSTSLSPAAATAPGKLISLAGETGALTFVLNGISKILGLPQMKLAWIAASGPAERLHPAMERLEVIADTYLSVGTPIQRALPTLLTNVLEEIQPQILERVRSNLRRLDDCIAATNGLCERLAADGGWTAVVSVPRSHSEEEWVLRWLELDHVLLHPGYFFDFQRNGYVVISLLPPPEIFLEAVQRVFNRIQQEMAG